MEVNHAGPRRKRGRARRRVGRRIQVRGVRYDLHGARDAREPGREGRAEVGFLCIASSRIVLGARGVLLEDRSAPVTLQPLELPDAFRGLTPRHFVEGFEADGEEGILVR